MRNALVLIAAATLAACSLLAPRSAPPPAADTAVPGLADIATAREVAAAEGATLYRSMSRRVPKDRTKTIAHRPFEEPLTLKLALNSR